MKLRVLVRLGFISVIAASAFDCVAADKVTQVTSSVESHVTSSGGRKFESVEYPKAPIDPADLVIKYPLPSDPELKKITTILKENGALDEVVKGINQAIALPKDLTIVADVCEEPNAYYESEGRQITLCLNLVKYYIETFSQDETLNRDEAMKDAIAATVFTLFHEMGHALVDIYDLPVTGKEEDAVDDLASLLSLAVDDDGGLLWAAILDYAASANARDENEELEFWDEHSLDEQRMYNIACILYGSDPTKFAEVVDDEWLPEARAERCSDEYTQKEKSWGTLLAPHLKS